MPVVLRCRWHAFGKDQAAGESFPLVNGLDPGVPCCSCRQMFLREGRQVVQLHLHAVDRR